MKPFPDEYHKRKMNADTKVTRKCMKQPAVCVHLLLASHSLPSCCIEASGPALKWGEILLLLVMVLRLVG